MIRFLKCLVFCLLFQNAAAQSNFYSYTDVGEGPALVLIHPFPADQDIWKAQREGLKHRFRVITVDLWGFGQSGEVNGKAVSMNEYAEEIRMVLDHLQLPNAIVGGESMGGYVALAFLKKYPQRVNSLLLSGTQSIADNEDTKTQRELAAQEILSNGTSSFIQAFISKALSSQASEPIKAELLEILESQKATALASALRGMAQREDTSSILASAEIPVLILSGEYDSVIPPRQSENLHEIARNSALVIIENAGHLTSLEQPQQWNQAVLDYYASFAKTTGYELNKEKD